MEVFISFQSQIWSVPLYELGEGARWENSPPLGEKLIKTMAHALKFGFPVWFYSTSFPGQCKKGTLDTYENAVFKKKVLQQAIHKKLPFTMKEFSI